MAKYSISGSLGGHDIEGDIRREYEGGWSQEELAHRAGLDRTYISSLERQKYAPTLDVLDKLAGALEVGSSALIRGSE